jgi:hypothetical protein
LFVGLTAGANNSSGTDNTFVGFEAGISNTAGSGNSYFGSDAGRNATGSNNAFFGPAAGYGSSGTNSGSDNTGFGHLSGFNLSSGANNSFFGVGSGQSTSGGGSNTFVGRSAGLYNSTGNDNTALGYNAGISNTSEAGNTFIGSSATGASTITNATAIGFQAQVTQSNTLILGSISGTNSATADTKVGIGVTAPQKMLSVRDGMSVDQGNANNGTVATLTFGSNSGEGIGSQRTAGGNQFGLDFYTSSTRRMSIANATGHVGIGTTLPKSRLDVNGGNVYVSSAGDGVILKSPNGVACAVLTINDTGSLIVAPITCP